MQPHIHAADPEHLLRLLPEAPRLWIVECKRQRLFRMEAGELLDSTPVSTSRYGFGDQPESLKTPLGLHRISSRIGSGAPPGQRFRHRQPWDRIPEPWTGGSGDAILTRILWLDGLVPGLNTHSRSRYIYIHGTHQEELLGKPASNGCIRMGNQVLANWFDALRDPLPLVWIGTMEQIP